VGKVNFVRGRVRPSATVDASVGYDLWVHDQRSLRLQADVFNLADRLNVINFAGTFSGTAVAPGRTFAIRLRGGF
jgi:outer membrane receptor for Fe3+-dicitrate